MDGHISLIPDGVSMQIVDGHIYANTIHVSAENVCVSIDPSQHNYSAPSPTEHFIIEEAVQDGSEIVIENDESGFRVLHNNDVEDDIEPSISIKEEDRDHISTHLIHDPVTPSISHHDYVASLPQVITKAEVIETSIHVPDTFHDPDCGLVIEEAVEQEIESSHNLEDEEIVRSKPLTAMYLQQKIPESAYSQSRPVHRLISPTKSPGSSRFTLKPSQGTDLSYDDTYSDSDIGRMRLPYNDPISVYHPNTGEIHFKLDTDVSTLPKKNQRSVGAILAASEAIKHQDIASEVEVGTYEEEVSEPRKRKRKQTLKGRGGIDDDIEQIRKAAKNVAFTLKGMKDGKDTKRRKKPRIRLTLTKSKRKQNSTYSDDDDDDAEYQTASSRRGRKKKGYPGAREEVPNIIYQCEYCEKQFKTREKVRTHTKIHTEERAFSCDICGSKYRRREHLVRHYRRHTNERPYQCLECGKSYMRAEHLKRHSFDHSGEKPFECSMCPKKFTRHDRLIKHSLVHDK